MKGIAFIIVGILGWIQFLWQPIYFGISVENVYFWVICDNCRTILWLFSSIMLLMGIVLVLLSKLKSSDYNDLVEKGTTFYLVFGMAIEFLSIF